MVQETVKQKVDMNELKSGGFIKQTQKDLFTVRLKVPGGRITPEKLIKIAEVAKKYSRLGYCHLSFRQSVEIIGVHIDDFDVVIKELAAVGQKVASCGPRVRVPTACGGCEYNPNGIMDTQAKSLEVDEKFFGSPCHHKFKMSFSGCPIDCSRTRGMDLGFQGVVYPVWNKDLCNGCTLCAKACLEGAIVSDKEGRPVFDESKCVYCGDCIRACPTDAWKDKKKGWLVRVGGKHGRHPREADQVVNFLPDSKVDDFITATLQWYKENGRKKERIGVSIDRVGLDKFRKDVANAFIKD
ncbi:MAG: 4Fe-4S binding protein [Candidatus Loosdrechtia sp.]|uniref:4Fe-4S binding protein n=1 Tax=Candidatus Loosdrechtia sp. TaxID=3101272 RepID=UPI003A6F8352|nr:MAG: 4Fe-4S binding protein [Candidatus Jettenia sp. AMX2]